MTDLFVARKRLEDSKLETSFSILERTVLASAIFTLWLSVASVHRPTAPHNICGGAGAIWPTGATAVAAGAPGMVPCSCCTCGTW